MGPGKLSFDVGGSATIDMASVIFAGDMGGWRTNLEATSERETIVPGRRQADNLWLRCRLSLFCFCDQIAHPPTLHFGVGVPSQRRCYFTRYSTLRTVPYYCTTPVATEHCLTVSAKARAYYSIANVYALHLVEYVRTKYCTFDSRHYLLYTVLYAVLPTASAVARWVCGTGSTEWLL